MELSPSELRAFEIEFQSVSEDDRRTIITNRPTWERIYPEWAVIPEDIYIVLMGRFLRGARDGIGLPWAVRSWASGAVVGSLTGLAFTYFVDRSQWFWTAYLIPVAIAGAVVFALTFPWKNGISKSARLELVKSADRVAASLLTQNSEMTDVRQQASPVDHTNMFDVPPQR